MKYTIGPANVASRASPNVALPAVAAFPASQTGIETIIHSIIRPIKVVSMPGRVSTIAAEIKNKPQIMSGKSTYLTLPM
jgi:hypothetical protein